MKEKEVSSSVIIAIVAVIIVVGVVIGFYVATRDSNGGIDGGRGTPPSAMLTLTAENTAANTVTLTISHEGGDDLALADLQIKATNTAAGGMVTIDDLTALGVGTTFTVGEEGSISYTYTGVGTGDVLTVYIIHEPSKQKIFSSSSVLVH